MTAASKKEIGTLLVSLASRAGVCGPGSWFSIELPLEARVIESLARSPLGAGATLELPNISETKAVESLGLRLERRRSPVEVVVIDRINRTPTDN